MAERGRTGLVYRQKNERMRRRLVRVRLIPWVPRPALSPAESSDALVDDRIGEGADLLDLDAHGVAGLHENRRLAREADAVRRPGEDDGAGQERFAAAEELDQGRNVE